MALDYTPDTDEVRTIYAVELFQTRHAQDHIHDSLSDGDREFDRWLAAHDAGVEADAWDEAADKLVWNDGNWHTSEAETIVHARKHIKRLNPYRKGQ